MRYKELIIPEGEFPILGSQEYSDFIDRASLESGIRLFLQRHRRRPNYPYFDTKFNPNTGGQHPEENYKFLLGWFIGRGGEAAATHLRILDDLEGLEDIREEARAMLQLFVDASSDAIVAMIEQNSGRCPFCSNREFQAIDTNGALVSLDPEERDPTDIFCAKALVASGIPDKVAVGKQLFEEFMEACYDFRYVTEGANQDRTLASESCFMLAFGAIPLLVRETSSPSEQLKWAQMLARMIRFVLGRHYDEKTAVFSEYVTRDTAEKKPFLGPGHASELVGLGFQGLEAIRELELNLPEEVQAALDLADREFPRLLLKSFSLGYNPKHHGINQSVDNRTGEILNSQLPWWSLPETMRAAVRAAAVQADSDTKLQLLETARIMSNDYYIYYPNPELLLFPFRTRSGATGEVVDIMPTVSEADPLYHTNLALIDMKDAVKQLRFN